MHASYCLSELSSEWHLLLHISATIYYTLYACIPVTQYTAPGPVRELSYKMTTNTSVKVTWKPPEETDGDIVSYFVQHGEYQNESTPTVEVDVRNEHAVIHDMGKLPLYMIEYCIIVFIYCISACSAKGTNAKTPTAYVYAVPLHFHSRKYNHIPHFSVPLQGI